MNLPATLYRTARSVHPHPTWGDAFARVKYCLRGMILPHLTAEWFALLGSPCLEPLVQRQPHIRSKLQRPYLHRRLTQRERLNVLKQHYRFVREHLGDRIRAEIFEPRGCALATLPVPEAGRFTLRLFYGAAFEKEGDLTLGLFDETAGTPLFTLTFCVNRFGAGEPSGIFIGGLQGHLTAIQRELVVTLTRSLHGLRPKALLVFTMQRLCQFWGFSRLLAVSDQEHVYRHFRKRKELHASYDEFWGECLGQRLPGVHFQLPVHPRVRNLEELSRNKRPVYRRRYEMLARLGEEIQERLLPRLEHPPEPALNLDPQWAESVTLDFSHLAFEVP